MKTHRKIVAMAGFSLFLIMLIVGFSLRNVTDAFSTLIAILLTSAGILIVFAISLHRTVAVPLSELLDVARELHGGNPDYPLQETSDIAQLAEYLDGIADKLTCSSTEVKQASEKYQAAIRHEINNPLTTVIGNVELLIERYENKDKDLTARLEVVLNNALRIAEITKRPQEIKMGNIADDRNGVNMTDPT